MLGHPPFSHNILRKYQTAFGTVFNEIGVIRRNSAGVVQQTIDVPLSYARKEKILARLVADPTTDRPTALVLPRMSYEMMSMEYDPERKLRSTGRNSIVYTDEHEYKHILNPVPYDLHFNLYVYARYQLDGNQIVEQILPFFTPQFDLTIQLIPDMDIVLDAPIVTSGFPSCEDTYDGQYIDRRALIWTLPFTMKAYLYGPERVTPLIKFADVKLYDATRFDNIGDAVGNTAAIDRVTVQPGQDANGNATSDLTITIPYSEIEKDEEWDYVTNIYGSLEPSHGTGGENPYMRAESKMFYVSGKSANTVKG